MKFFDLHSDTITECYSQNKSLEKNDLHISLERGQYLEKWTQVFAIWIPDDIRGNDAEEYYEKIRLQETVGGQARADNNAYRLI